MGEQLFELNGEKWDLEELASCFEEGNATVKKFDDSHYLVLQVDGAKSDDELRTTGETALKRMNAICLVLDERFRPPSISGLSRRDPTTGKISTFVSLQCHIQARSGMLGKPTLLNPDDTPSPRFSGSCRIVWSARLVPGFKRLGYCEGFAMSLDMPGFLLPTPEPPTIGAGFSTRLLTSCGRPSERNAERYEYSGINFGSG